MRRFDRMGQPPNGDGQAFTAPRRLSSRWAEKVDRKVHPHVKPVGLIERLIGAVTNPGDLVVDPAAGSFTVLQAARRMGRDFVGCDLAYQVQSVANPTVLHAAITLA